MSEVVELKSPDGASTASILVSQGFNCFRFCTQVGDRLADLLWSEGQFQDGQSRPSGSGIPILFPYAGRIKAAELKWQEKSYPQQPADGRGNSLHGFVHARPWKVEACSDDYIRGSFQASVQDPSIADHWPADFRITAEYQLESHRLRASYTIENPDDVPLPCGFGLHPYFRVPPLANQSANQWLVSLPVQRRWVLEDMNATGQQEAVDNAETLQQGCRFPEINFDDVFTELLTDDDQVVATLRLAGGDFRISLSFDDSFRECVVYTPDHREAICIEPYTSVPDAFRLQSSACDAGLIVLQPGERRSYQMSIKVDA